MQYINAIHSLPKSASVCAFPCREKDLQSLFNKGEKRREEKKNKKAFYDLQTPNNHDGRKVGR